jgi:transposase
VPPSIEPKDDETASQPGTQSNGREPRLERARHTRTVETVAIASVTTCASCGADLSETPWQGHERRTRIDLLFEKVVSHVDAEVKSCPRCQALTKGSFPADLSGPLQYGTGIKAFVLHLLVSQMVALKRVSHTLATLIEQIVSEATLLKWVLQLHQALAEWERTAIEELLAQPTLHVDETSLRVERKNHWIYLARGADITVKCLHPQRGLEAITAINIIPRYGGDCWASYLSYGDSGHGLCGAHLLRELTFVIESNGYPWARHLKRLLKETRAKVAERDNKQLTEAEYKKLRKRYRTILTQGAQQLPPLPPRKQGSRGRVAKSDAHNLWGRFKHYEHAVLLFAKLPHVPFSRVEVWRGSRRSRLSVPAPFVWRCLTSRSVVPFPHPARRTRRADFPQRALFQGLRPSHSNGRRGAPTGVSVPTLHTGTGRGIGGTPFPVCRAYASTRSADVAPRSCRSGGKPAPPVLG